MALNHAIFPGIASVCLVLKWQIDRQRVLCFPSSDLLKVADIRRRSRWDLTTAVIVYTTTQISGISPNRT